MRATTFQSISQCTMGLLRHRRAQEPASMPIQQKTHFTEISPRTTLRRVKRSQRMRRIPNASSRPSAAPAMSATQSLISALRPNWGWMSSIAPPNATAPIKSPTKSREVHELVRTTRNGLRHIYGCEHRDGEACSQEGSNNAAEGEEIHECDLRVGVQLRKSGMW